ncbi:septal ring lytic transglycosylase RlpA family protein [Sphingopyxis sp. Root1497]|uniref:septal ring lytic transglycosylase RlpA family protein n=1 Tax=Sphingopyxis sp. Root1497 TaxID=1736474 RepID=UPI0009E96AFC|nr:septal ring lytic transglycosylase RlpA family protein [Sphingopyxis sp. Root1497]
MKSIGNRGVILAATLLLAGCGSVDGKRDGGPVAGPAPAPGGSALVDGPPKLGAPFTVAGTTYTPSDIADYDDVGYASWYGEELAGSPTAIGESFNPDGISAAHKTLPLPSYVEVTALDTGRTIVVRVNDRGPMANDRLIDLSRGAAQQLGLTGGVAAVRVRRTNPPMAERAQLRSGGAVGERLATPDTLLVLLRNKLKDRPAPAGVVAATASKPTPSAPAPGGDRFIVEGPGAKAATKPAITRPTAAKPATPPPAAKPAPADSGSYAVQVAAFSSQSRANAAAKSVGGTVTKMGNLWRVRMGPFASEAEALAAAGKAKAKGFRDAQVQRDR